MPPYAAKSDLNQQEIVDALRGIGCQVDSLHRVGGGVPDLLVSFRGITTVIEVKRPGGKLTGKQWSWWREHNGSGAVVENITEALDHIVNLTL